MGTNLGTAYGRIIVDGSGAARGFAVAGRGASGFAKAAKVSFAVAAAAGLGFGAALASSVSVAADFEQQLGDMRAVLRPTGQELNALREQALKLGADTKFSALEAAAAQTELAKGGLDAAQILGGALPGALALAAAGDLELARAAEISVNTMEQFGLAAADLTSVADVLAQGANRSTASVESLSQGLAAGGATAAGFGFTLADTVAALQALQATTNGGSDAGTSLKAALNALNAPTAKQAKLQRELGLQLHDANGEMKSFPELAGELERATNDMSKADRQRILTTLAGSDGQRALLGLLRAGEPVLRANAAANRESGAAAETSAIKQDTLKGKLEELSGAVETIKIRVGSALIPALSAGAVATANWLSMLGDSQGLKDFGEALAGGFEFAAGEIQARWAVVQPILMQIGSIGAEALTAFGAAAADAAPLLLTLFQASATVLGAVLAIVEPIVSLVATLASVPGVAQGAAAAFLAVAAALTVLKAATVATAITGSLATLGTAAAASAANVGKMAAVISTVKAVSPGAGAALAALATPAGLAALAIGGVTAALFVLASNRGASDTANVIAAANERLATASDIAKAAVQGLDTALAGLQDSSIAARQAKLDLNTALAQQREVASQVASGALKGAAADRAQEQSSIAVARARLQVSRTEKDLVKDRAAGVREVQRQLATRGAELTASRQAVNTLAQEAGRQRALAGDLNTARAARDRNSVAVGRARVAEAAASEVTRELQVRQRELVNRLNSAPAAYNKQIRSIEDMAEAAGPGKLQRQLRGTADELRAIRDQDISNAFAAAKRGAEQLGQPLGRINPAVAKAVARFRELQDAAGTPVELDIQVDARVPLNRLRDVTEAAEEVPESTETVMRADASDALSAAESLLSAVNRLDGRVVTTTFRSNRTETTTRRTVTAPAGQTQDSAAPSLSEELVKPFTEAISEARAVQEEFVQRVQRGFDFLVGARAGLDDRLAAIDAAEDARAQRRERARLARDVADTARKLAKAKDDERAGARSAANQARAALIEFDRVAKIEAKRRPLRLRIEAIDGAEAALSGLESSLSDVGSRITDALQAAFDRTLKGLDDGLTAALSGIDDGLSASLAGIDAGLSTALKGIDDSLTATVGAIDAGLRATLAAIDGSAAAQQARAIDAITQAARLTRDERDAARRRTDLTTAVTDAQGVEAAAGDLVGRRQAAVDRARTDSERTAALALLAEAVKAQEEARKARERAAEELADFEQDQALAALDRQREAIEASLTAQREGAEAAAEQQRTAAEEAATAAREDVQEKADRDRAARETEAQAERDHHQSLYDEARAAAEREFVARQAEVDRELGNLREQLRTGEITHKQFLKRLSAIYNDPTIKAALTDSGKELGLDFARGLARSRAAVEANARELAAIVRRYLHLNSPAETGPLAYNPREPGRVLGLDLAAGLASTVTSVRNAAAVVAEAARIAPSALVAPPPLSLAGAYGAAGAGGPVTNHNERTVHQYVDVQVEGPEDARTLSERLHWYEMTYGGRL